MAAVINTNISSLTAQRNLSMSQTALSTSMQRLSSGLRINSAKDDAAGMAISERFTTQVRGLNQASRNANDGISLSQTAEGALGEMTSNLQRIRELAVQSANSTNSPSDRAALDLEVKQRLDEIDRVASQSSFNGVKILDGSFGDANFQVGANVGDTIALSLTTSMRASALGAIASTKSTGLTAGLVETATPTASAASGIFTVAASGTGTDAFQVLVDNKLVSDRVVGATAGNLDTDLNAWLLTTDGAGYTKEGSFATNDLVISKTDGTDMAITTSFSSGVGATGGAGLTSGGTFAGAFVATHTGGAPATPLELTAGDLSVKVGADDAVAITGTFNTKAALADHVNANVAGAFASVVDGELQITSTSALIIDGTAALGLASTEVDDGSLSDVSVSTVAGANDAIQRVDAALTSVSTLRSTFGAIQNRFESVIANLSTTAENLSAARSRIQDADFAIETANLSRAQILQQAGTAMVAQANQLPQGVLALLRQ